jgi:hypothetical protein
MDDSANDALANVLRNTTEMQNPPARRQPVRKPSGNSPRRCR